MRSKNETIENKILCEEFFLSYGLVINMQYGEVWLYLIMKYQLVKRDL